MTKTLTCRVPIEGIPTPKERVVEEFAQFLGTIAPRYMYRRDMSQPFYYGKMTVPITVLSESLRLPSNCGREIEYNLDTSAAAGNLEGFMSTNAMNPAMAIRNIYTNTLPRIRGWEDVIFLHQPLNFLVNGILVTGELICKEIGAITSQPFHWFMKEASKESNTLGNRFAAGAAALIIGLPLLVCVAWPFFIGGNLCSYTRKISDGASNLISSSLAWLSGIAGTYETKYPSVTVSLKTIGKNLLLMAGCGVPFISGALHYGINKANKLFSPPKEAGQFHSESPTQLSKSNANTPKRRSSSASIESRLNHGKTSVSKQQHSEVELVSVSRASESDVKTIEAPQTPKTPKPLTTETEIGERTSLLDPSRDSNRRSLSR